MPSSSKAGRWPFKPDNGSPNLLDGTMLVMVVARRRPSRVAYQRQHSEEQRQWALAYLGGKCVRCGSIERLEFDHIIPATKRYTISSKIGRFSKERLLPELRKCQLLCRPCHDKKSRAEFEAPDWHHGTTTGYQRYNCRCRPCSDAQAEFNRRQRVSSGGRGPYLKASQRVHGTTARYYAGCRCDLCKAAKAEVERARRLSKQAGVVK